MGLWAGALQRPRSQFDAASFYEAVAVGFAVMVAVAGRRAPAKEGSVMLAHVVEQRAALVVCATGSVLCAQLATAHANLAIAVVVVASAIFSLLSVTAVASALETIVPRRTSTAERYRRPS
jgi:cobalamin synthase